MGAGEISVAEEHLATEISLRVLALQREARASRAPAATPVMLAAPAGEQHVVALRMIANLLRDAGYDVVMLGADVPPDALAIAAGRHQPDVVCLTATMPGGSDQVLIAIHEVHSECPPRRSWSAAAASTSRPGPARDHGLRARLRGGRRGRRARQARGPQLSAFEDPRHHDRVDGLDQRCADRALVGPSGGEDPAAGCGGVVGGPAQLGDAVGDPQPACGAVALVGEADAPGVDEAQVADRPVVLLVGVSGHDDCGAGVAERLGPAIGRRQAGEHLVVAARARVAVEDAVDLERQRHVAERPRRVVPELGGGDRRGDGRQVVLRRLGAADRRGDLALAVAADPADVDGQRVQAVERATANGPGTASPPTSTTSGSAARGSASTASSASTFAWMSYSARTFMPRC